MDIQDLLKRLPAKPGVYLYKDARGKIIYVGKAAVLKNRVRQYFQNSRARDTKTDLLVADIADIDWLVVASEIEALFLESELIKRYKPKYNIELRDDKHYEYVRIDLKSAHPTVQIVRRPLDDGNEYIGPFVQGIREALKLLRRIFPYDTAAASTNTRSRLLSDLGLSPGLEQGRTALPEYRANLRKLMRYLRGKHAELEKQLAREMKAAARGQEYEKAARLRNQISSLKSLRAQVIFGDREFFDITKDQALDGLKKLLGKHSHAVSALRRIEGYDISHMSGTNNVASMVVFTDGVSDKQEYRKFKMRTPGNDDFAHMREVVARRFSGRNLQEWPKPDLILIDGGKGQLSSALAVLEDLKLKIPAIGLAKRFEEIIIPTISFAQGPSLRKRGRIDGKGANLLQGRTLRKQEQFEVVQLPLSSPVVQLLQRIRDESHRFAVSYHSTLKVKSQSHSVLEDIPGFGTKTRQKLIKAFGSLRALTQASEEDLAQIIGQHKTRALLQYLHQNRKVY